MRKKWTHNSYPTYTHHHRTNQDCSVVSAPTDSGIYHGQPWGLQHTYEGALTRLHNLVTQPVCGDFVVAVSNRVILLWWLNIKKKRQGWVGEGMNVQHMWLDFCTLCFVVTWTFAWFVCLNTHPPELSWNKVENGVCTVETHGKTLAQDVACVIIRRVADGQEHFSFSQSRTFPLTEVRDHKRNGMTNAQVGQFISKFYDRSELNRACTRADQIVTSCTIALSQFTKSWI